ncbi:AAA family ATPase [Legionella israelensis]|uniref:AAA family ATPase n=1 Tax=Legionella israelensis TaxID=454 RepID=UPI00117CD5CC|nr:AAA family ATPase [Legionella israelensis]QDP72195.1 AAA family ATPase [Legionella israelensis]
MNNAANFDNVFLETKEYLRFKEFCNACITYQYIGICYGSPGVGKTQSAEQYSQFHQLLKIHTKGYGIEDNLNISPEFAACQTIFYTPIAPISPHQMINTVYSQIRIFNDLIYYANANNIIHEQNFTNEDDKKAFIESMKLPNKEYCRLIIIDEAERLGYPAMELLRSLYDRSNIAIVFVGMPGLEKKLSRYPQLYSRIGFAHEYKPLCTEEMLFILEQYWKKLGLTFEPGNFSDHEAATTIMRTTSGNFRLLNRLFMQIDRILRVNQFKHISHEVVLAARDCLLIGNE